MSTETTTDTEDPEDISSGADVKQEPRSPSPVEEEVTKCHICEYKANGYHYGAIACGSCSAFFRRAVDNSYTCVAEENCLVYKTQRNDCEYCRYQKCLAVGMIYVMNGKLGTAKPSNEDVEVDQEQDVAKAKAPQHKGKKVCLVCGDKPSGCHYGIMSCESCKSFYKRTRVEKKIYTCTKEDETCVVDKTSRTKCPHCRYKKYGELRMESGVKEPDTFEQIDDGEGEDDFGDGETFSGDPTLCTICGDKVSGLHYGILTCESCKCFFKRTVLMGKGYACKQEKNCRINIKRRKACPYCRYQKCMELGMKSDSIQSPSAKSKSQGTRKRKNDSEEEAPEYSDVEYTPYGSGIVKRRRRGVKGRASRGARKSERLSWTVKKRKTLYSDGEETDDDDYVEIRPSSPKKPNTSRRLPAAKSSGNIADSNEAGGDVQVQGEDHIVDQILGKRINWLGKGAAKKQSVEYLISWKGFNASDNSWEPSHNLNCPELISAYEGTLDSGEVNGAVSTSFYQRVKRRPGQRR